MAETVIIEEVNREYWTDGVTKYVRVDVGAVNKSLKDKVGYCSKDIEYTDSPDVVVAAFVTYARQEIVNAANALNNGMNYA